MDPLSITVSVITLLEISAKVTKKAHDIRSQYKGTSITLSSIATECSAVTAALSTLQSMLTNGLPSLDNITLGGLDCIIVGCTVTLSVLEEYLKELQLESLNPDSISASIKALTRVKKWRAVWNEAEMKELCQQLQGHKSSITMILTIAQSQSQSQTYKILEANSRQLSQLLLKRASTSRKKRASSLVDDSTLILGNTMNLVMNEPNSEVSNTTFAFDDIILNSQVYTKVMQNRQAATTSERGIKAEQITPQSDEEEAEQSLMAEWSTYFLGGKRTKQSVSASEKREAQPRSTFCELAKVFPRFDWKIAERPAPRLESESPDAASLEGDVEQRPDHEASNSSIVGLGEPEWDVLFKVYSFWGFNPVHNQAKDGYPFLRCKANELFDVVGASEDGKLWLAKSHDDKTNLVGWIWKENFYEFSA